MNIAFPAFFLLLLIISGFVLLKSYDRTEKTSLESKNFDLAFSLAILLAIILHTAFLSVLSLGGQPVDFVICSKLLTGVKLMDSELSRIEEDLGVVSSYFISINIIACIIGKICQKVIFTYAKYKDSPLAFDTPWYYELKGKVSKEEDADFIKISCLVDTKEGGFLYYGILEDFYLNKSGELDRMVVSEVSRRKLTQDDICDDKPNRFYKIKGDRLILKYENIKNLNIEYLYIIEN